MPNQLYISDHVRQVIELYQPVLDNRTARTTVSEELEAMAEVLRSAHRNGDERSVIQLSNWHPELVGQSVRYIMNSRLDRADYQLALAREHAFDTWAQVVTWGNISFNNDFERAVDVMLSGDVVQLRFLLQRDSRLISERSVYNHGATLLHYLGSNGVETRRQIVPYNLSRLVRTLLDAGADPAATAFLYRAQLTTLELLTSSAHPADAGVMEETVAVLRSYKSDIQL